MSTITFRRIRMTSFAVTGVPINTITFQRIRMAITQLPTVVALVVDRLFTEGMLRLLRSWASPRQEGSGAGERYRHL